MTMTYTTLLISTESVSKSNTISMNMWNTTTSITTTGTSLLKSTSPVIILVWFEIIAACITYGLGFVGNLLSLIIFFSQEEFRTVSTGVLFLLMTISNTIHLWTLTTEFLGVFNVYVYPNAFLQCRFNFFTQNVSRAVSTYLAIGATLDRLIRSEFPMRSRIICTRRNAMKLALICVIIFSILCLFWFCPLNTINPLTNLCYAGQSAIYNSFINNIFFPVRFIAVCLIPVIIMSLANIRIVSNIRQSRRRVQQGNTIIAVTNPGSMLRQMTVLDRMLVYMMLVNVTAFIITQIPFHVYTIVHVYFKTSDQTTNALVRAILLIWSSIYFGIGAYLYCLASPLFREKLLKLMKAIFNYRIHHHRR